MSPLQLSFGTSHDALTKRLWLTSASHPFPTVFVVCLESVEQTNHQLAKTIYIFYRYILAWRPDVSTDASRKTRVLSQFKFTTAACLMENTM